MAAYNRVILVGNITREIDLTKTQSGTAVTDIGLAVNERRKNQSGEWAEDTQFIDALAVQMKATASMTLTLFRLPLTTPAASF